MLIRNVFVSDRGLEVLSKRQDQLFYAGTGLEVGFGCNLFVGGYSAINAFEFNMRGIIQPQTYWSRLLINFYIGYMDVTPTYAVDDCLKLRSLDKNTWKNIVIPLPQDIGIITKFIFCFVGDNDVSLAVKGMQFRLKTCN